jgi:hypothetical protein
MQETKQDSLYNNDTEEKAVKYENIPPPPSVENIIENTEDSPKKVIDLSFEEPENSNQENDNDDEDEFVEEPVY